MTNTTVKTLLVFLASVLFAFACGSDNKDTKAVNNADDAKHAYLGIDPAIDKALNLGMQGFNAASSANIAPQTANGDIQGKLVVGGQVDQGASANKTMRLTTDFTSYEDVVALSAGDANLLHVIYDAVSGGTTTLEIKLMNLPNGTFTGTFIQTLHMSGDLQGDVTLNLTFTGDIRATSTGGIERVPGSTVITGTATSPYGTYTVNITR